MLKPKDEGKARMQVVAGQVAVEKLRQQVEEETKDAIRAKMDAEREAKDMMKAAQQMIADANRDAVAVQREGQKKIDAAEANVSYRMQQESLTKEWNSGNWFHRLVMWVDGDKPDGF